MMRTAFGVFGILWGIIREIVNGVFRVAIGCLLYTSYGAVNSFLDALELTGDLTYKISGRKVLIYDGMKE